jgi:hypothetical protein
VVEQAVATLPPAMQSAATTVAQTTQTAAHTVTDATKQAQAAVQQVAQQATVSPRRALYRGRRFAVTYALLVAALAFLGALARRYRCNELTRSPYFSASASASFWLGASATIWKTGWSASGRISAH